MPRDPELAELDRLAAEVERSDVEWRHRKRIRPLVEQADDTPGLVTPEEVEAAAEADRAAMFRIRVLLRRLPCTASVAPTWSRTGVPTIAELADYLERVLERQAAAVASYEADRTELHELRRRLAGAVELADDIKRFAAELDQ